jgi:hypothetical protein
MSAKQATAHGLAISTTGLFLPNTFTLFEELHKSEDYSHAEKKLG